MARKKKIPDEIQQVIDSVKEIETNEIIIEEPVLPEHTDSFIWDIKKEDKIDYFDPELSYEITGYRPINQTK